METNKKYQIILADPPWKYNDKMKMLGIHGMIRGAESFYKTMALDDIKKLPINKIAENDCALYLWVTAPLHPLGEEVIKAWGFKYVNYGFVWIKKTKTGKNHMGMGHYTRGNAEICLFGVRGRMANKIKNHSISQIIEAPIMRHSQKPKEVREKIVALFGDLPRIELFARQKTEGWDSLGYDIDGKDIRESIKLLI